VGKVARPEHDVATPEVPKAGTWISAAKTSFRDIRPASSFSSTRDSVAKTAGTSRHLQESAASYAFFATPQRSGAAKKLQHAATPVKFAASSEEGVA
jgi:hypothetical protein